ncbi:hypothetical protein [Reichenbachiella faecimaris]|nr:hypothetical protein [Reichenbachiella faecimaris]
MAKKILYTVALLLAVFYANAQNSIGVNTDTPNPNAALDIRPVSGEVQGVLIPRLTTAERIGMTLVDEDNGLMVFDSDLGQLYIWFSGEWLPMAIEGASVVNTDGITINGDGGATPLAVNVGTGSDQIVQLDAAGLLPPVDGSQLINLPTSVNSGNGVTVSGTNLNLGGALTETANIITAAGSDVLIDGAGTLDIDALADFSAQSNFSDINVTGGTITGSSLTQADNTFLLEDESTGNNVAFELSGLTTNQSYLMPDASGQIALISDITTGLWAENAGDINYSVGNVGIGTVTPLSPLQVEDGLSFFRFQNSTEGIFGNFIGSELYVDKSNTTDNQLRRISGAPGSFIFFENGETSFIHVNSGAADAAADLNADVESSLTLLSDGSAEFEGNVTFKSNEAIALPVGNDTDRSAIASPQDGMIRYSNESGFEGFEGLVLGSWEPLGGSGSALTLPYSDGLGSSAVPLFELINTDVGGGTTASFGNSSDLDATLKVYTDLGIGGTGLLGGITLASFDDGSVLHNVSRITSNVLDGTAAGFAGDLEFEVSNGAVLSKALSLKHDGDAELSGAIKIGDTGNTMDTSDEGMLKYVLGSGYEYWNGGSWQLLGAGTLTGATNGLNVNGSNIELGGNLNTTTEIAANGFEFTVRRGSASNAPTMHLYNDNGGIGTGGSLVLEGMNSVSNPATLGKIETLMTSTTSGAESSELVLSVVTSGSLIEGLKIDDVGEVNANYYKYNNPITKYYGIAPGDFNMIQQAAADNVLVANNGNSVYISSASAAAGAQISAPVHLPDGAEIQAVEIFGRNTTGINATVHFMAKSYSTAVTFDDTVIVPDGTSGITGFQIAASVGKIIDNFSNNYFIYIDIPTSSGSTADFTGARITYTVTSVD